MRRDHRKAELGLALGMLLLAAQGIGLASPVLGTPTLLASSVVDGSHFYPGVANPVPGTRYSGDYSYSTVFGSPADSFVTAPIAVPPMSGGHSDANLSLTYGLSADAGTLQASNELSASANSGYSANGFTRSQALDWFVLEGSSDPVTIAVNIAVQGVVDSGFYWDGATGPSDGGSNTHALFATTLIVLTDQYDTGRQRVVVFQGGTPDANRNCADPWVGTWSPTSTVGLDVCIPRGGEQTINYIVRSNPFTVLPGVPFLLGLTFDSRVTVSGSPVGPLSVSTDFMDPGLVLPGSFSGLSDPLFQETFLVTTQAGGYQTLSEAGLRVRNAVPEPGTLALLGLALAALRIARHEWGRSRVAAS